MLIVNSALALFNGALIFSRRIWCECVIGGVCCGGECHCDDGYCCGDVWHSDADPDAPCAEGERFLVWTGEATECCGCLGPGFFDPDQNGGRVGDEAVRAGLCCPVCGGAQFRDENDECPQRCCVDGVCTCQTPSNCNGLSLPGNCLIGCPVPCCDSDGECSIVDTPLACVAPDVVGNALDCENACKGACCVDGELTENSPTTKAECDAIEGCWWGVGSTTCKQEEFCREPFDDDCCEHVVSSGSSLTFTGPRKKRCPELDSCGFQVTVYVKAKQPVYVHGLQFGNPYETCEETFFFMLCNDEFTVTPAPYPCDGTLNELEIKVCWDETEGYFLENPYETLRFKCCDGTYLLSNCDCDCVTTLLYEGPGCTSNATLIIAGDCVIDASGTGPITLEGSYFNSRDCNRTLTLTGTNTSDNTTGDIPEPQGSPTLSVVKNGVGRWRLVGNSGFTGTCTAKSGTLVIGNDVLEAGASPVGTQNPIVGDTTPGATGTVALLVEAGFSVERDVTVASGAGVDQFVMVGGASESGVVTFASGTNLNIGRDMALVARTGGTVWFSMLWKQSSGTGTPSADVDIGASGYAGTFELLTSGTLETTGTVTVRYGNAVLGTSTVLKAAGLTLNDGTALQVANSTDGIDPTTPVTAGDATLTLYFASHVVSQDLDSLEVTGTMTLDGNGTLTVADLSGAGGIVVDGATLNINANTMTGTLDIDSGTVNVNTLIDNPGSLATSATLTSSTLTVAFSGDPATGAEYVLLAGPTGNSYGSVTLTGTTATGTYDSETSTLTID